MFHSTWKPVGIAILICLSPLAVNAKEPQHSQNVKDYDLTYLPGDSKQSFKEFVTSHNCLSGWWRFERETDKHWIGSLIYPTDNARPGARYGIGNISVRKIEGLSIDLSNKKDFQSVVVLEYDPAKMIERNRASDSRVLQCRLVAHTPLNTKTQSKDHPARFLFLKSNELALQQKIQEAK